MTQRDPTEVEVAEAVARARTGAPSGIGALYEWYAADLLRLTTRLLASADDAEDIVHDLFVGLPEQLARYDERGRLRAWLRVTAIGMARMRVRRERRRSDVLTRETSHEGARETTASNDTALALDIERAVGGLSDSLRQVFVLKQWEGYSHDEIAQLLGISSQASRVRHARALSALRTLLGS
jgi:RNA polymerase sigma-70 factor (ECF subfamily)